MHVTGTATATIDRPIQQAWAVLTDHAGMSSWGPGLKVTVIEPGAPEPNGVGTVRQIKTRLPVPPIVEEITAFEPTRLLGYRARSGVPLRDYHGEVELTERGDQTWVRYTVHADSRIPVLERIAVKAVASTLLSAYVRAASRS